MECIFCQIVNKEIESPIQYEDEKLVVFPSKFPAADTHFLFVPKKHIQSMAHVQDTDKEILGEVMYRASKFAEDHGIIDYKLIFNVGKYTQIPHLHLHLLSGENLHDNT